MKVERHEWKDKLGDDWALETVVDPPHDTTIDGFVTRNMGGQPMLRMPGYTSQQTIQDELAREILRLADENAALMADAERLKKALDAYHRFNNIGNDLKSAQWTVGEWANGSDVSDQDLAYACKYLEDMA